MNIIMMTTPEQAQNTHVYKFSQEITILGPMILIF